MTEAQNLQKIFTEVELYEIDKHFYKISVISKKK